MVVARRWLLLPMPGPDKSSCSLGSYLCLRLVMGQTSGIHGTVILVILDILNHLLWEPLGEPKHLTHVQVCS